jgi:ribosome biogenesis GTPase
MNGLVIRGSRNVFTVRTGSGETECRLKGKVLKGVEGYYNPLAPGDIVEIQGGLITGLEKRRNAFARFNQKGQSLQLLAANADLVVCVTTPLSPPFRPRFADRVLFEADYSGIPAVLVCNKYDLAGEDAGPDIEERLEDFIRIGYPVFRLSALTGEGMEAFRCFLAGKRAVLAGQSGVGKSSLVKALVPDAEIKTGPVNAKYDRGNHTTVQGVLRDIPGLENRDGKTAGIIDTPGIRRFVPQRVPPGEVILYMREFASLAGRCSFGLSCSHETEPGCKIMEAVDAGVIHEDRYGTFLRIKAEMAGTEAYPDYD